MRRTLEVNVASGGPVTGGLAVLISLLCLFASAAGVRAQGTAPAPAQTEPLTYTATNPPRRGTVFNLQALRGHSVTVAFPASWLDVAQGGLSGREAQTLVDLADVAFAQMEEIVRGRPAAAAGVDSPLLIAVIDTGSAGGYTALGANRVEISTRTLAEVRAAVRAGELPDIVVHEVAHAFDLYHAYILDYYQDSAHAWTEFMIPYVKYRMRAGQFGTHAEGALLDQTRLLTSRWDARAPLGGGLWAQCVQQGTGCEADGVRANRAWAGLLLRYARVFGHEALGRAFGRLAAALAARVPPGATAAERNDYLAEVLSDGAKADITCALDAWRWETGAAVRDRLRARYPGQAAQCADADADTYSAASGDPDDHDRAAWPGAVEVANGRDDDGDGYADDLRVDISQASPGSGGMPARLRGKLRPDAPVARYSFTTGAPQSVLVRSLSTTPGWSFVTRLRPAGANSPFDTVEELFSNVDGSAKTVVPLARPGAWVVEVQGVFPPGASDGEFDVLIAGPRAEEEPPSDWLAAQLTPGGGEGEFSLSAGAAVPPALVAQGVQVRFWASRGGVSASEPVAADGGVAPWTWRLDDAARARGQLSGVRAQLVAGGTPVSGVSMPIWAGAEGGTTLRPLPANADLAARARGSQTTRSVSAGDVLTVEYEFSNGGPDSAPGAVASIRLDAGLALRGATATRGTLELDRAAGVVTVRLGTLHPRERVAVAVTADTGAAAGRLVTATARVVAPAAEAVDFAAANNVAAVGVQVSGVAPCPAVNTLVADQQRVEAGKPVLITWAVTGPVDVITINGASGFGPFSSASFTPAASTTYVLTAAKAGCVTASREVRVEVFPPVDYEARSLPLRRAEDANARSLVPGSLARVTLPLPGVALAEQTPGPASGLLVEVNGRVATLVAATPATGTSVTLDFVVPADAPVAEAPTFTVRASASGGVLAERRIADGGARFASSAPALWEASGIALALDAWDFTTITDQSRAKAGDRVILFASGLGAAGRVVVQAVNADGSPRALLEVEDVRELRGLPGVFQITAKVPAGLVGPTSAEITMSVGQGSASPRVLLPVE